MSLINFASISFSKGAKIEESFFNLESFSPVSLDVLSALTLCCFSKHFFFLSRIPLSNPVFYFYCFLFQFPSVFSFFFIMDPLGDFTFSTCFSSQLKKLIKFFLIITHRS